MAVMLALLTLLAPLAVAGEHPAVKIIGMIQKLQEQVKEEGAEDTHVYGKFTYWCEETIKEKNKLIKESKEIIEVSTSTIEALEADIETLKIEIAKLTEEIEEMEEARTNATNIRNDEHAVYMKSKTDLEETITSIKDCITAMKDGMAGGFLQAKTLIDAWSPTHATSRVMTMFMQKKGKQTEDPNLAKFEGRGGGDATYVAKGGDVTEILKKMLMEYEDDLVALEKAEAETKAAYDLADDAKKMAIAASTKSKETKEEVLGEKGQQLSNTKDDLKEAQDALLADTTVLDETKTTCKKRGDEYEQHMKTREGETAAMQQAIEILEKVTGVRTPEEKGAVFTQLRSVRAHKHTDPRAAIVAVLRKVKSGKNTALAKLADKIEKLGGTQMPGSGMFDSIKNMIQKMIFHLMDEQKNEDEHKHWCDKEITNTELMITEKTEKSEDADSTITQLAEKIQNLKNGINDNQNFVATTEAEIAERTEDRAADKKENEATIKDAEDAQTAIAQAVAVLETFYKESGEVAKEAWEAFAQTKAVAHRAEPEPELWEEEKYTGTEGGAAVIGMLENCATDFAKMQSQAEADETAHQDDFDTFLTQAQMDKAARTKDTEMKQSRKGRFEEKKSAKEESYDHTTKELAGTKQYREDLVHACEDGDSSYAERKDARTQEIEALREAQGILEKAFEEPEGF